MTEDGDNVSNSSYPCLWGRIPALGNLPLLSAESVQERDICSFTDYILVGLGLFPTPLDFQPVLISQSQGSTLYYVFS